MKRHRQIKFCYGSKKNFSTLIFSSIEEAAPNSWLPMGLRVEIVIEKSNSHLSHQKIIALTAELSCE
jgi:hypothetical protein